MKINPEHLKLGFEFECVVDSNSDLASLRHSYHSGSYCDLLNNHFRIETDGSLHSNDMDRAFVDCTTAEIVSKTYGLDEFDEIKNSFIKIDDLVRYINVNETCGLHINFSVERRHIPKVFTLTLLKTLRERLFNLIPADKREAYKEDYFRRYSQRVSKYEQYGSNKYLEFNVKEMEGFIEWRGVHCRHLRKNPSLDSSELFLRECIDFISKVNYIIFETLNEFYDKKIIETLRADAWLDPRLAVDKEFNFSIRSNDKMFDDYEYGGLRRNIPTLRGVSITIENRSDALIDLDTRLSKNFNSPTSRSLKRELDDVEELRDGYTLKVRKNRVKSGVFVDVTEDEPESSNEAEDVHTVSRQEYERMEYERLRDQMRRDSRYREIINRQIGEQLRDVRPVEVSPGYRWEVTAESQAFFDSLNIDSMIGQSGGSCQTSPPAPPSQPEPVSSINQIIEATEQEILESIGAVTEGSR